MTSDAASIAKERAAEVALADRAIGTSGIAENRARQPKRRRASAHTTISAHGAPLVWLTGGALATAIAMIVGLLVFIVYQGVQTFWPLSVVQLNVEGASGAVVPMLGEITRNERYKPGTEMLKQLERDSPSLAAKAKAAMDSAGGMLRRSLIWTGRTDSLEFAGSRAVWVNDFAIQSEARPPWAMTFERFDGGRSYGTPDSFLIDGKAVASTPEEVWAKYNEFHHEVMARWRRSVSLDRHDRGAIDRRQKTARLAVVATQLDLDAWKRDRPEDSKAIEKAAAIVADKQKQKDQIDQEAVREKSELDAEIKKFDTENARYAIRFTAAGNEQIVLSLANIVRAYPANRLSLWGKLGVYFSRWGEFLTADPRESNTEGGVFPAIWGTVAMTLIMSVLVVPFGVLAALYLREYAKAGPIVSAIRISINNLAGVPSIVFGVFGLGLFCYVIGASIDQLFFKAALAEGSPTFGTGGIMWASLTLALLTLPVVIVATEEALAAVPNSMREGSYACGGSKWQTIRRIVLPRAMPGIMTGMILAMARGAGEVAP